jgi:hypothetical protein
VYSGNADLFSQIEGRLLSDLDLSSLDHIWNQPNALATFALTTGGKYPIINYGDLSNANRDVDVRNQRYATFFHTIVDKIFSESTFTKSGSIFSDANYLKVLVPYSNKIEKHSASWMNSRKFRVNGLSSTISATSPNKIFQIGIDNDSTSGFYDLASLITLGTTTDASLAAPAAFLTIDEPTEWRHIATITFTVNAWTDGVSSLGISLALGNEYTYLHPDTADGGGTGTFTIEVDTTHLYPSTSFDEFWTFELGSTNVTVDNLLWEGVPTESLVYGSTWNVSSNLPEGMTQVQFLKTLCQKYGLFIYADSITGVVSFSSFDDIVNNLNRARDWSDKLHDQKLAHKTEYRLGNYGQVNNLKYKEDSSDKDIALGFGNGTISVDDETLAPDVNIMELVFAATHSDYFLENLQVPLIRKIENSVFKTTTLPRLLIDDTQDIAGNPIVYNDGTATTNVTTDVPLCYFIINGRDFNLGFNDSLIELYYESLSEILVKAKKISVLMYLTSVDVFRFDHTIPVYLSQHASFFYVNKISNFKGAGLTSVELIRLQSDASSFTEILVDVIDPPENLELQEDGGYSLGEDGSTLAREDGN